MPRASDASSGCFRRKQANLSLAQGLLDCMVQNNADFTLTFRGLCKAAASPEGEAGVRNLFTDPTAHDAWAEAWRRRLTEDGTVTVQERLSVMNTANPAVIPRNHLVEEAISAAVNNSDFSLFEDLIAVLAKPYEDVSSATLVRYATSPGPDQVVRQTFCGT